MGERKGVNKYYPPDYRPEKGSLNKYHGTHALRERARKLDQGILIIRFEMPYNIWCDGCGNHIGMGVRYNAEKRKVGMYYSTPIYQFRMKCHLCDSHFEMKTDPQNLDYVVVCGARRQERRWDPTQNSQVVPEDKDTTQKLVTDAMFRLEHGEADKRKGKEAAPSLARLEDMQNRWKDDYTSNKILRQIFRDKKKEKQEKEKNNKLLLIKSSLSIPLLDENPEDVKMAKLLKLTPLQSYEERQREKRIEIDSKPILPQLVKNLNQNQKDLKREELVRIKNCKNSTETRISLVASEYNDSGDTNSYEIKDIFFDIRSEYLMDTQALARVSTTQRKRRRKIERKNEFSIYHKEVCDLIEKCAQSWKPECLPGKPNLEEILLNNIFARTASKIIDDNCRLSQLCSRNMMKEEPLIHTITRNGHVEPNLKFVNKLITHDEDYACVIKWDSKDFLIPANSSFLLSNDLNILTKTNRRYDVIIIDPPWTNKSLKRKKCYNTSSEVNFLSLPIKDLASKNCLIGVWTTNNSYLINYVKSVMFPHWGVEYETDWHWLKVTRYGEFVVPLNNHTKKPYENLILGRMTGSMENITSNLIFVSVPSCFHSHKPLIRDLLKNFINKEVKGLEIFSRSLCSGWTSFGDECEHK
uniref:Uncharacterized protein n=1 Tax=Strigamia maritima TaxID=126957 RepID=T1ITA7_STRMM